ncbi:MAG TPA: DUF2066 domain-containing protein [Bradyrhizobium sp.]|uniref:DUF2066 domain-containing protein n=1 Tax=Bradyrhizobium sp. TaxID=376 RepID=UPI002C602FC2|nr:DUF2066 domain-containing protein [Bradyrhizobium sp.]HLZ00817.1 DUF2066 domain-containing protein [Bradyrhizobium sp.]
MIRPLVPALLLVHFAAIPAAHASPRWYSLFEPICIHVSELTGDASPKTRNDLAERVAGAVHVRIEAIERRGRKVWWEPRCIKPDLPGFDRQLMLELSIKRQHITQQGSDLNLVIAGGSSPSGFLPDRQIQPVVLLEQDAISDDRVVDALVRFVDRIFVAELHQAYGLGSPNTADYLYRAQTAVTGQGVENRTTGFAACLEEVLVKVSADPSLVGDPRLEPYKAKAGQFVHDHEYRDQMAGTPKRDEQGSRDRPYDLIAYFDETKIDAILGELGRKPWPSPRPSLGVFVVMEQGGHARIVTSSDGKSTDLQRDSLLAASDLRGMVIALPTVAALARSNVNAADLTGTPSSKLAAVVAEQGGDIALLGRLVWSDDDLGWITEWQMDWQGRPHRWQSRGLSFDETFRRGIGGAAQILAGNGDPQ